jgi:hypothetical protein
MSTVPLISAAMPVPEPPPVTAIETSGATSRYASAQASARLTSVSEPLFWMLYLVATPIGNLGALDFIASEDTRTKLHETMTRGPLSALLAAVQAMDKVRGEFVLVVGGAGG